MQQNCNWMSKNRYQGDLPKFLSRIYQFPMRIARVFPAFGLFSLILPPVPSCKLGHSPNIIYIFQILDRRSISSSSFSAPVKVLIFDDFWFIKNHMEAKKDIFHIVFEHKRQIGSSFVLSSINMYFNSLWKHFPKNICFRIFKHILI